MMCNHVSEWNFSVNVQYHGVMNGYLNLYFWQCGRDEELLGRGLELNDILQNLLAKHDAIASGLPIPTEVTNLSPKPNEACAASSLKSTDAGDSSPTPNGNHPAPVASVTRALIDEEEEEEDDFALLARRLFVTT